VVVDTVRGYVLPIRFNSKISDMEIYQATIGKIDLLVSLITADKTILREVRVSRHFLALSIQGLVDKTARVPSGGHGAN
jgi:hypothetical protein